jgi:hypothetical protein
MMSVTTYHMMNKVFISKETSMQTRRENKVAKASFFSLPWKGTPQYGLFSNLVILKNWKVFSKIGKF